jgi:LysM domain
MSLMSAAEAGDTAGASPVATRRGLRLARPAAGHDGIVHDGQVFDSTAFDGPVFDGPETGGPRFDGPESGGPESGGPVFDGPVFDGTAHGGPTADSTGQLRVTRVRVARQVSVRTLRAGGPARTRPGDAPRSSARTAASTRRATSTRRAAPPRAGVAAASARAASMRRVSTRSGSVTAGRGRADGVQRVSMRAASLQRASVQAVREGRPAAQSGLRLTQRGRRVLAMFAMLAAIAAATLIWTSAAGGAQTSRHDGQAGSGYRGMTQIVVRPGQTLWSIAAAAEPSANPWSVVQQIVDANALSGARVQAGQLLWVPKG